MRNPGGYALIVSPDEHEVKFDGLRCETVRPQHEADTFSCAHCSRVIHVRPRAPLDEFGSMCRNCMRMVCPAKECNDNCTPFMKKIEESERRDQIRRMNAFWI